VWGMIRERAECVDHVPCFGSELLVSETEMRDAFDTFPIDTVELRFHNINVKEIFCPNISLPPYSYPSGNWGADLGLSFCIFTETASGDVCSLTPEELYVISQIPI
jgi:hypothetical protein